MSKSLLWLLIGVGGTVGGFVPTLFGASYFSMWGILASGIGAFAGIYVFHKIDL
ncbi:MAG TPA: hypothetical protein VFB03_03860 [Candidatus Saccharimonadales bacterium]|nr:hypothetical protein [Candidatus Saccharimonadales bacterium]